MKTTHALLVAIALSALPALACSTDSSANDDPTLSQDEDLTSGYKATLTTDPSPVTVGAPASLAIKVSGPHGRVRHFDLVHTKPMHLIAVSSDLEDFIHVHPDVDSNGDLSIGDVTFARAEPYAVFMEYEPAGTSDERLSRARIAPAGSVAHKAHLSATDAFDGTMNRSATVDGTEVELVGTAGTKLTAKTPAHVVVRFRDDQGKPVTDLTNWLGMPAHAIIVSPDLTTFEHVHGMPEAGGTSTASGPIGIDLTLPKAGLYKMFLQFERGNTVLTVPFVLEAEALHGAPPPTPTCASMKCPTGQSCMVMGNPPAPMCM
jgi:hypothetical protein